MIHFFVRIPFAPDIFGTLWSECRFFLANIRITLVFPLYIPCDRSWDLQLVRVSQR